MAFVISLSMLLTIDRRWVRSVASSVACSMRLAMLYLTQYFWRCWMNSSTCTGLFALTPRLSGDVMSSCFPMRSRVSKSITIPR